MPLKKISAEEYLKKYKIDLNIQRSDLTNEMAIDLLKKASEALKDQRTQLQIAEAIKDGAFTLIQILKAAGAIGVLLV